MRRRTRRSSNAWRNGRTRAKHLGVDAIWRDTQRCKAGTQIAHEGRRSADVEITIAWQVKLLKYSRIQAPWSVEINIGPILRIGRTVANVSVVIDKRLEQPTRFLGKRMFAAATGAVKPPDFPRRCFA